MKIYNKIVLDIHSGKVLEEDSFEYDGDLMLCDSTSSSSSSISSSSTSSSSTSRSCVEIHTAETRCVDGDDLFNYGNAGDDIFSHTEHWSKMNGSPFFTGQSLLVETPDEEAPFSTSEGAVKPLMFDGDFDFSIIIKGIVFSVPAASASAYVGVGNPDNFAYYRLTVDASYPTSQTHLGVVRTGTTNHTGSTSADVVASEVKVRFVRIGTDAYVYVWDNVSSWTLLRFWSSGFNDKPCFVQVLSSSSGSNPEFTFNLDDLIVASADGYECLACRLGNHFYRGIVLLGDPDYFFPNTSDPNNGVLMEWINDLKERIMVSDPPYLTGGLTASSANQWTFKAGFQIENNLDTRWNAWIELGYMDTAGYAFNMGVYDSPYNNISNQNFTETSSGVRIGANRNNGRAEWKVFNNSGSKILDTFTGVSIPTSGEFKIIHTGNNTYEVYLNNVLYYTWVPDDWVAAGYISNRMYMTLGFNPVYSRGDCRWLYALVDDSICDILGSSSSRSSSSRSSSSRSSSSRSSSSTSSSSFSDCAISLNDNFSGIPNNDPPNPQRWTTPNAGTFIESDQLVQRPQPVSFTTTSTKYGLCGDFRATIDFRIETPITYLTSTQWDLLWVVNGTTDFLQFKILVLTSGLKWSSTIIGGGSALSTISETALGSNSGVLTIERTGNNTISVELDTFIVNTASGGQNIFTQPGVLVLVGNSTGPFNPDNRMFWDNLVVTADCVSCASSSSASLSSSSSSRSSSSRSSSSSSKSSSSSSLSISSSSTSLSSSSSSRSSSSRSSSRSSSSSSAVSVITPGGGETGDSYITVGNGVLEQHNFGSSRHLIAGGEGSAFSKALIKFDLSELNTYISNQSEILSAFLYFRIVTNKLNATAEYSLHRLEKDWSAGDGYGGVPERGDVSWIYAKTGIESWEKPGAAGLSDKTGKIGTVVVSPNTTPRMAFDVTSAVRYSFTNTEYYGFILEFYGGDKKGELEIASLEYPVIANRPFLQVNI